MPLYDFQCPKCHKVLEISKSLDDKSLPLCCEENCGVEMIRLLSPTSFQLKGGGWYRDGYSKKE